MPDDACRQRPEAPPARRSGAPAPGRPQDCRGAAEAPRVDGDPPPRRPAAGRLPHAVARRRPGPGRPARVPAPRRRAPHRLERHGAAADALRAPVHRRPRARGLVPGRPERAASTSAPTAAPSAASRASSSPCWRACSRATATASARCSTARAVDTVIPARGGRLHVLHLLQRMAQRPGRVGRRRDRTCATC